MVQAPQHVAAQVGVEPFTNVVCRRQVAMRDGVTTAVLTSWFPQALGQALPELLRRSRLTEELPEYRPAWGEDWVTARPPTSAEAREFGIKRGHPVTVVHARRFDDSDSVIEYAELVARGDAQVIYRYQYSPVGAP
jgi:DNA-binding GntR family transcriptional regulator